MKDSETYILAGSSMQDPGTYLCALQVCKTPCYKIMTLKYIVWIDEKRQNILNNS